MSNTTVQAKSTNAEATHSGVLLAPAVDIFETDAAITLLADMPGVSPDQLEIDLSEGILTITGSTTASDDGEEALSVEYRPATYQRKFTLSQSVDQAKIAASLEDGVLRLELPKAEKARPRKIQVTTH